MKKWFWAVPLLLVLAGAGALVWRNRVRRVIDQGPPDVRLYLVRMPNAADIATNYTGAKYEPRYGCYLGAYIDLDPNLKQTFKDEIGRVRKVPAEFDRVTKKKHALYFFYLGYGQALPTDWVKELGGNGHFVQVALEPNNGLAGVTDDAYLRKLARSLAATKAKIFLRFASEMNGPWVPYHGNPVLYIEKWRLVTKVMREEAPNVAMLWCPYVTPQRYIADYYPGDQYVDWVGANLYSVTYYNRDRRFPGLEDHPADLLKPVYDMYAGKKPMMICEYAAASFSAFENAQVESFAVENIKTLYASLPTLFPRVKCVTYFSGNNMLLKHRMNNDYTVTSNPAVLLAYQRAIAPAYFLSGERPDVVHAPIPLRAGDEVPASALYGVFARSPQRKAKVRVAVDGKSVAELDFPAGSEFRLELKPGSHQITCEALNADGTVVAREETTVQAVAPSPPS